jgi:sialic acid synthase SpsE
MIIIDAGSGNTCQNNYDYVKRMIDELAKVDTKKQCIIKWQLFREAGGNVPLNPEVFKYAYRYASALGFSTTASVFDIESLFYLIQFKVPFIKIAGNEKYYSLIDDIPAKMPVVCSRNPGIDIPKRKKGDSPISPILWPLCCVSEYPAKIQDYALNFEPKELLLGVSDHTTSWGLYNRVRPTIYECHYMLEDSLGLDAGDFARTPKQLKEIL